MKLRIAMVSEQASPLATDGAADAGGLSVHVAELAAALAAQGHEVRVYTRRATPDVPDLVPVQDGFQVEHVPAGPPQELPRDELLPYTGEFGRGLATRWRDGDFRPDIVHAHFWMSGLAALTATAGSTTPVILTYHALGTVKRRYQGDAGTGPANRVALERTLGQRVDRVVAQSAEEVTELTRLGVPRRRIAVIPSGVDTDRYTPHGDREERGAPLRILTVGQLVERKGFADLVRALRRVPDAELVVLGGPPAGQLKHHPEAKRLMALARRANVADRVRLVGAVPRADMPRWYRSADLLACAPLYEPFGLTPLEAMACGVPVVGYAVGGIAESVIDGVTGVLVPPGDVSALADALRATAADEVARLAYASAAVDRVRARYTWERTADGVRRLYHELLGVELVDPPVLSEVS